MESPGPGRRFLGIRVGGLGVSGLVGLGLGFRGLEASGFRIMVLWAFGFSGSKFKGLGFRV